MWVVLGVLRMNSDLDRPSESSAVYNRNLRSTFNVVHRERNWENLFLAIQMYLKESVSDF